MSSKAEVCLLCQSKRPSRALCNCCQTYLCLDHLREHEQLLHHQFEPLADRLNQMVEQFEHLNIDSFLRGNRDELDRWREESIESIEKIYQKKLKEIGEFYSRRLEELSRKTKEIQDELGQIVRNENGTNEHVRHFTQQLDDIERQRKHLEAKPLTLEFRPIQLDSSLIRVNLEQSRLPRSRAILTIPFLSTDSHSIASNSSCILFSDHSQLFLCDHSLNLVDQSDIRDDILVRDLGWLERLNQFVVLSDEHLFLLDERRWFLERSSTVETPPNGHWHRLTSSKDQLYLTAYRWGTRIYQYDLSSGTI